METRTLFMQLVEEQKAASAALTEARRKTEAAFTAMVEAQRHYEENPSELTLAALGEAKAAYESITQVRLNYCNHFARVTAACDLALKDYIRERRLQRIANEKNV